MRTLLALTLLLFLAPGCEKPADPAPAESGDTEASALLAKYTDFTLQAPLDGYNDAQREMLGKLIEVADLMDQAFWRQAYGDREALMASIESDALKRFAEINYGPWDRLDTNAPFVPGVGAKPAGANYYPADMSAEEFEAAAAKDEALRGLYTMVRRDEAGELTAIPYSTHFADLLEPAAALLREAADLAADPDFADYLRLSADALLSDEYFERDLAWMSMKQNPIDFVVGPIETYEDQLNGYKAAFEGYVLLKDMAWSERLSRYATLLPDLQRGLPVDEAYKTESPGTDSDLNAYDVIYYAGDCNAGSKTIAINLPNDERVQLEKGTHRLQLKNAMQAKFDKILLPIAGELIATDQRELITFDAFFANTMFHEVAHGLGIKQTIDGSSTVRAALRNHASALEEGKADVLGLYMITTLLAHNEPTGAELEEHFVTFVTSIFRSVRFGGSSAHGRANLIRFNYFTEYGAFVRDEASGTYRVDLEKIGEATDALSEKILVLQGDGDYDAVDAFVNEYAVVGDQLQADLDRLAAAGIPVDIVFEQGPAVLGL